MRIALIKTSSMGDVVHALPVVTDLRAAMPSIVIDWVVEESFADLPALHPGVHEVIPVAIRRWRRQLTRRTTWDEIATVRERLRAARYDLALDLQGLMKSLVVARWTGAPIAGFSRGSAREPLAALGYARAYDVDPAIHAIERLRRLAAQALSIRAEGLPVFGLRPVAPSPLPELAGARYAVFLHATSRAEKQWPDARWVELGVSLSSQDVRMVLPWGSSGEQLRAQQLAAAIPGARVAPAMTLAQCASLLSGAWGVVGVDTGLTHLSAALEVPTVALFAATPAWRFGPYWTDRARSLGNDGVWPDAAAVESALKALASRREDPRRA